jgi:hypothetical protein
MGDIIRALSWPHFVFLFALAFLFVFRGQLAGFIARITSIDKSGVKTAPAPEAQREKKKTEAVQELLLAVGDSIVLRDIEGRIKSDLVNRELDTESDASRVLIKYLAASIMLLDFEQIHGLIFGSQIYLLKKLNEVAGQGYKRDYVEGHFEHVKELYSAQLGNWSFEQYMFFLLSRLLVTVNNEIYHITNYGVEYLTWIAKNGRREDLLL